MTANPYEDAARQRKVARLVMVLATFGFTADEVAGFDDKQRALAEKAAGVPESSVDKTWAAVVEALRAHERMAVGL